MKINGKKIGPWGVRWTPGSKLGAEPLSDQMCNCKSLPRCAQKASTEDWIRGDCSSCNKASQTGTQFSSGQPLSRVQNFGTPWTTARQASLSITNSRSLLKLMPIESVMPSNHLILCCPFSSCPQSLPASGSFPMTQLFAWEGQSIGVSASASVLPMNTQDWSPLGHPKGWISLQPKGLARVFSNTTAQKHQFFGAQLSSQSNSHIRPFMTTGKTIALTRRTFAGKVMSLLFNMPFRLVITFLPKSKHLLISWVQSPSAVILEPKEIKYDTASTVSPSISHEVMEPDTMILVFWMLSFKPTFSLSSFTFTKRLFSSSSLSAIRVVSSAYLSYWYFSRPSWFQLVLLPAQVSHDVLCI